MRGLIAFVAFVVLYWLVRRQLVSRLAAGTISFAVFAVALAALLAAFPIWLLVVAGVGLSAFTVVLSASLLFTSVLVSAWVFSRLSRRRDSS